MFGKGFGWPEILLILVVVLVLFGATKLPQIGKSLGSGIREFKNGISGSDESKTPKAKDAPPKSPGAEH